MFSPDPFRRDNRPKRGLTVALALSLSLHLLPFIRHDQAAPPQPPASPPISARLRPPPTIVTPETAPVLAPEIAPAAASAPLSLEQPALTPTPPKPQTTAPSTAPIPEKKPKLTRSPPGRAVTWQGEVQRQLKQQQEHGLFYPAEAIAQGLEGEALVLLILDASGQVSAARLEESSGHPPLDNAALRAVRALRSIPADAPREVLLPVRFRLK